MNQDRQKLSHQDISEKMPESGYVFSLSEEFFNNCPIVVLLIFWIANCNYYFITLSFKKINYVRS